MKRRVIPYSEEELAFIEAHRHDLRPQAHAAFVQHFGRMDVSLINYASLCKRKGWLTGRTGQFHKGQTSHNKGKSFPARGHSSETQFRKGSVPKNRRPLWSERLSADGYIEMKVPQRNPHTGHATRFVHKHRYIWEQANGPLPEGHALKCRDGNKQNTDPANWIAIPRAILPRLNGRFGRGYDTAPPELKPAILATAQLEHAAREAGRKDE